MYLLPVYNETDIKIEIIVDGKKKKKKHRSVASHTALFRDKKLIIYYIPVPVHPETLTCTGCIPNNCFSMKNHE